MIKVYVAVPTTGTIVDSQVYALREIEKKYKDKVELIYPDNCVRRIFHDFARNAHVEDFLDSGADILWFLDSDVTPPTHILDLVTEHLDKWVVSGAVYPVFMIPPGFGDCQVVFTAYNLFDGVLRPKPTVPQQGLDYVDGLATGCLMIKREVFTEKLSTAPYFNFTFDPNTKVMTEGEDMYFARKMSEQGIKFFTDYSMVCRHQKNVDLLEINNYAMRFANDAIQAYEKKVRETLMASMQKKKEEQAKPKLYLPTYK